MNINYDSPFNFKPIPAITPLDGYWQNGTWKFNMSEISAGAASQPSWIEITLSGLTALTLVNSLPDGLTALKLFGGTEQLPEQYLDTVVLSGGCEQRNLPSGFTQVEYLESSGTQYIDTGIVLKSEATITTVGQNVQSSVGAGPYSFWGFMGYATMPRWGWSIYQNKWLTDLNTTSQKPVPVDTNKHTFINTCYYENNVLQYDSLLDGNSIFTSAQLVLSPATYTSNTLSAYLFARNNDGTAGNFLSCRIFSHEIVQDDIKVLSLVPCRRNSDNVLGMYDTVTGNFLTNAGTGTFTAGSDVVPTPETPMNIICNNGVLKINTITSGKNAINTSDTEQGYISSTIGQEPTIRPSSASIVIKNAIKVSNGKKYKFSYYSDTTGNRECNIVNNNNNNGIVTSKLALSCRAGLNEYIIEADTDGYLWVTVQLGDFSVIKPTVYEIGQIYADGTQEVVTDSLGNTANAERLLAVGDYKDTQEVISGSVTRNVGIKVLDGTETYNKNTSRPNAFSLALEYFPSIEARKFMLCTHFMGTTDLNDLNYDNYIFAGSVVNLSINASIADNATSFANWLADQYAQGTPVIVVYPTSSATTESVTGQFLSKSPVTQTAGSIDNLPIAETSSSHTTPTPQQPLDIVSNNGVVKVSPNLVEFNETRINSSTWDSADKTKGFEVYADVYGKSVGASMLTNANAFGIFVPCKQGKSISLNFFDYEPFYSRCLYCEITADRKCNTTPQEYVQAGPIIQKTFTLTKSDSIGFIFEWYINSQQTRNYTKENYTVINGQTPPTSYIPYFNGGSATAEMLLKVGTYQDEQSVLDGNVTRNVGIKVLDGTENWFATTQYLSSMFNLGIKNMYAEPSSTTTNRKSPYCTHFNRSTNWLIPSARGGYIQSLGTGSTNVIGLGYLDGNDSSISEFRQFLADQYNAGTPVIIVYPLAESTTETVTGQPLTTQAGTNIVEITQASMDSLPLEVSYKAGVAVTITEVENAQLDNNVEVTING